MSVVVFAHPKGGTGKSSLSFNYAVYKNNQKKTKMSFIDLDTQKSVSFLNALRGVSEGKYPLLNIAEDINNEDDVIDFVEAHRDDVDIIIDTGGYDAKINRYAIMLADLVIVPVSFSPLETNRLYDFLNDIVREMETELGKKLLIWVVFNRIHPNVKNVSDVASTFDRFNVRFFDTVIYQRASMEYSIADGGSVVENKDDIKGKEMMLSFFAEIDNILKRI